MNTRIPKIGEKWVMDVDDGPWEEKPKSIVTIVDVKDGWVRYDYPALKDRRRRLDSFLCGFKPLYQSSSK